MSVNPTLGPLRKKKKVGDLAQRYRDDLPGPALNPKKRKKGDGDLSQTYKAHGAEYQDGKGES